MRRSAFVVLVTVLLGMFLATSPAAAEPSANIANPTGGQVITSDSLVPVEVRVEKSVADPAVNTVQVQLFGDGRSYSRVALRCSAGCGSTSQTWVGQFDPRPGPIRNGAWKLQVNVNDGAFQDKISINLSLPPSPVANLKASPQQGAVQLTWNPAPEPDITGYRIVRITNGQPQVLKTLGPDARSYTDRPPASGEFTYQVISIRPSGTTSGGERTSTPASTKASVSSPDTSQDKKSPTNSGAPAQGGGAAVGNTSNGGGTAPESSPSGGGSAPDAPGGGSTRPDAGRGPLAAHVPPPPQARRGFGFDLRSLARVFGYQPPPPEGEGEEGYFGEGEGYSEELDYSGIDPVTGEPIAVPVGDSGLQGMLISHLADRPLLVSLAAGLLFVVLAFYILRWIRRSPVSHAAAQDDSPAVLGGSAASPTARRRFFAARGASATPARRIPSPTTAPLSPRGSGQTRPDSSQDVGTTNDQLGTSSPPERRPTRPPAPTPLFARDGEAVRVSRDQAREGGKRGRGESSLFAQRRSPATPLSARDRSESANGSETVKVLRSGPSKETGPNVR